MTFISVLETLFIGPLKLIFEVIFQGAYEFVGNPGIAIIVLSLLMNVLVLPLYRRADAMQEQSRDVEAKLHDGVAHIKKTFTGDERMMILQTYYRQNNYKPTDVLNGSVSLLLEIPFFMAAYQFLSHLKILEGVSFGPIKNLGAPDGLLVIAGISINVLPVLMTLVNIISSALYLKGFPLKTKIQLYGMAMFFLVFLYTSPAGLVFYWTLNNVFSLVKNIFYKLKNPQKVLRILLSVAGIGAIIFSFFVSKYAIKETQPVLFVIGLLLQLPLVINILKSRVKFESKKEWPAPNRRMFISGALFLTVFIGLLIPTNFIADSPQEYVDVLYFYHPLWYVLSAACFAAGTFLVWVGVFYWLASPKGKVVFERVIWVLCGFATVNYMFFGTKLGNISAALIYDDGLKFAVSEQVINVLVLVAVGVVLYFVIVKWAKLAKGVLLTATLALAVMSAINIFAVDKSIKQLQDPTSGAALQVAGNKPQFQLSKDGKNVVVIMLDRAMGEYVPYILNEKPELKEKFDGFTYYSNVISYGGHTNMGVPAMMGGYEYTPVEMNKRDDEPLVDKHNEALKVMPVLFSKSGYNVTVCDAPYANYKWVPDMSIYDGYDNINKYIAKGYFGTKEMKQQTIENNHRNFFCFGVMKSMPLFMQRTFYSGGDYNQAATPEGFTSQIRYGMSKSAGRSKSFMDSYTTLENMSNMTLISGDKKNNFLFLSNDTTHEPMLLKAPEYTPETDIDNTDYDNANKDRFTVDGNTINIDTDKKMIHYQTNMAALLRLGDWFDYLKENDVYDNTRIIIVSDHGYYLYQTEQLIHGNLDMSSFFPLLIVKDFDSEGFSVSDEFMTNADVPTMAVNGLIENPVNPFTGKVINNDEKTAHDQYIMTYKDWKIENNHGNVYNAATWAVVHNNIWDKNDWRFIDRNVVLKEHQIP